MVPRSPSIAYPWVGRITVAGLVAPRSTCLPFSYVNCIITQKYYECAIMSHKKLFQTRFPPPLRHKGYFAYECLIIPRRGWPLRAASVCPADAGDIGIYGRLFS
jgi:hypothetical protein